MEVQGRSVGVEPARLIGQVGFHAAVRLRVQLVSQSGVSDGPREVVGAPEGLVLWIEDGVDPLCEACALMGIGEAQEQSYREDRYQHPQETFLGWVMIPQFPNHQRERKGARIREGR